MKKHGFSLLELSIVLTILAIVLAGGITLSTAKVEQNQIENTYDEIKEIDDALAVYASANAALPCPSSVTRTRTHAEFGRSDTACDGTSPGMRRVEYPTGSGTFVIMGGVPFYTLELPDEYLSDSWNTRYYYAVSEPLITSTTAASVGNILVQDDASAAISDQVAWVVLSSGPSREGGFSAKAGTLISACDGGNLDGENCDPDGVFKDAVFNNGDVDANFYDDYIRWETVGRLLEGDGASGSGDGTPIDVKISSIKNDGDFNGYAEMYKWTINNGCAGYTVCTESDVKKYVMKNGDLSLGSAAYITSDTQGGADPECTGFTSNSGALTATGWGTSNFAEPYTCDTMLPVLCCSWD